MSGLTVEDPISLIENDVPNESTILREEVAVQGYDSDISEDDDDELNYVTVQDKTFSTPGIAPAPQHADPTEFEIPSYRLACGVVYPGSVVEMQDRSERKPDVLISGDFLFVKAVIEYVEPEKVVLRGYRLRRCSYIRPLFEAKLNELFMLIHTNVNDERAPFDQGLEDIDINEFLNIRKCVFTHLSYDILGLRQTNCLVPARIADDWVSLKSWIFGEGTLICRWVHIVEVYDRKKGTSYAGEVRRMYQREVAAFTVKENSTSFPFSQFAIPSPTPASSTYSFLASTNSTHKRTRSLEVVDSPKPKRGQLSPQKSKVYSVGDGFSGSGGVSSGVSQAGLRVAWGLEKDANAMAAYRKNNPGAMHLEMDACDFSRIIKRCIHGVDIMHFSCPCQFWSINHTVEGKDDQTNMETIYIPEAWLRKLRSRMFTMEQAPGLLMIERHRQHFRNLLNDFLTLGYNVRYKVQDQAWFGIPQQRKRLIFVGTKIGQPLPPFPHPIHGPAGTGLKRFVTIGDALAPLTRNEFRFRNHKYHQVHEEKKMDRRPIDAHTSMAKCVTVSGGDNAHPSGKRAMTVMELARIQGFPLDHGFSGSRSDAKKQCGNAWPAESNKHYFLTWAATLEAFDNGLIEAEDEIHDLFDFLEQKGIRIPKPPPIVIDDDYRPSSFGNVSPTQPQYRYLSRLEKTVKPRVPLILWAREKNVQPRLPKVKRAATTTTSTVGFDGSLDNRSRRSSPKPRWRTGLQPERVGNDDDGDEVVFLGSFRKGV